MSSAGTAHLHLQADPIPSNMLQGAGRQHDRCLPTTQYVVGIHTFAGECGSFQSLSYTVAKNKVNNLQNIFFIILAYHF